MVFFFFSSKLVPVIMAAKFFSIARVSYYAFPSYGLYSQLFFWERPSASLRNVLGCLQAADVSVPVL